MAGKLTNASHVEARMMRATRPASAPWRSARIAPLLAQAAG